MYNYTALIEGTNIVEWSLIFNNMAGGFLITMLVVIGSLITFMLSSRATQRNSVGFITTGFIWMMISSLLWVIQWEGLRLLPTFVPVVYAILFGLGLFMHTNDGGVGNV